MQLTNQEQFSIASAVEPDHYEGDLILQVALHFDLTMALGTALKYVCRAGRKDGNPFAQEISKSIWYLEWSKKNELGRENLWCSDQDRANAILKYTKQLVEAYGLDYKRAIVVENILSAIDSEIGGYGLALDMAITAMKVILKEGVS